MNALRALLAIAALACATFVAAQAPGDGERGSTPPGSSQDGSAPSDGAIKGGAILPGESGGVPQGSPDTTPERAAARCYELSGTLREQCLRDASSAGAGGTRAPSSPAPTQRDPVTAPPPQNPTGK